MQLIVAFVEPKNHKPENEVELRMVPLIFLFNFPACNDN